MVTTTENEFPKDKKPEARIDETREEQIKRLYNEGKNLYQIAARVYEFQGEEQIERVREVLGIMAPPATQLMDEE